MKLLPKYWTKNNESVQAYQVADLATLRSYLEEAKRLWHEDWLDLDNQDEGSCTGGKGFRVWFAAPRKRSANRSLVVEAPPTQGNVSAFKSHHRALAYLQDNGIDANYYDGWMD
jgi:hypothetical protein